MTLLALPSVCIKLLSLSAKSIPVKCKKGGGIHKDDIRLFIKSQFCIVNFTPVFLCLYVCLSCFRSGAISGWDWLGLIGLDWDLCAGLLYEHRFAMLITLKLAFLVFFLYC